MATREKRAPRLRLYKRTGKGRVILNSQHFYTKADFDTPEAHEEYLDLIRRWEAGDRKPLREIRRPDRLDDPWTVTDLVKSYLDYIKRAGLYMKNGEPTSQRGKIEVALRELRESCGNMPLKQFKKPPLLKLRDALCQHKGLSLGGVNVKIRLIRRAVVWGEERGFVPEQCLASILTLRPLREPKTVRRQPVEEEVVAAIIPELPTPVAAMVQIQWLTSMRPGEVCAMRWMDINRQPDPQGNWTYTVASPKTEHLGEVVRYRLNEDAQRILSQFGKPPDEFIFSPKDTVRELWPEGEQLRSSVRDRYDKNSYCRVIVRACERLGIERFTPHQIRHAVITQVANDPVHGPGAAQALANHRSMRSTLLYVHRNTELAARAVQRLRLPAG